jgi:hypothetical protein
LLWSGEKDSQLPRTHRNCAKSIHEAAEFASALKPIDFDDATFDHSAAAFNNPDHVSIVIHNYRWRLGLAQGEPKYDDLEKRLAAGPVITVPTITLEGDANAASHPDPSAYAKKFVGRYTHRLIKGGRWP